MIDNGQLLKVELVLTKGLLHDLMFEAVYLNNN